MIIDVAGLIWLIIVVFLLIIALIAARGRGRY